MALQVWLPLTKDLRNQGLSNVTVTNSGATFNSAGKLGGCYIFDGADDAISIGNLSALVETNFSFACWFYHSDTWSTKSYETILGGPSGFELEAKNGSTNSPVIKAYSWGGGSFTYELNKWNHLVMTRTSSETKFYLNGELKLIGTIGSIPSGDYFVGAWKTSTSQNYKGSICDVRIYDHCLSPMEVKRISQGLACHYNLSDGNIESTYNYLQNKSFSNYGSYGFGSKGTISITTEVEPPIAGNEVALVTNSSTTSGNSAVEIATSIYPGTIMNKDDTFTVTAYIMGKGATIDKRAHIHLYNTNGTNTQSTGKDYVFTNKWQRIEYTLKWNYDTPSNSSLNCYVVGYMAPQEQFYVSSIQVEKKDHSTPFTADTRTSTVIYDTSGYCNNGTINGNLTTSTDTPKYQASIYMPTAATISHPRCLDNTSQEWTCAAWVKPDAAGNYQNLNNFNESNRLYHSTYPLLYLNSGTNDYYNYGNLALPANQWSHIVFVFKNSTGTKLIYVNGENRTNTGGPNKTSTPKGIPDTVIIGGSYAGYMCDYREYATALSASDVKSLYQNCATIDPDGTIRGKIR